MIQDLDLIDTHTATWEFKASASNEHLPGFDEGNTHIGTFTIDTSVTESISDTNDGATLGWSFTLDNNNAMLQSLALGQTITQIYTVSFDDHGGTVTQDVTVTITGTNDAPTIVAAMRRRHRWGHRRRWHSHAVERRHDRDQGCRSGRHPYRRSRIEVVGCQRGSAGVCRGQSTRRDRDFRAHDGEREHQPTPPIPPRWAGPLRSTTTTRRCSRWRWARPSRKSIRSRFPTATVARFCRTSPSPSQVSTMRPRSMPSPRSCWTKRPTPAT